MADKDEPSPIITLIAFALIPVIVLYFGWATQTIWTWHLADRFGPLSLRQAVGLDIAAGLIMAKMPKAELEQTSAEKAKAFAHYLTYPLIGLSLSWVLRHWI